MIDIKNNKAKAGECYFVDTNVWYWATYAASKTFYGSDENSPREYQINNYPEFIQSALDVKAKLCYSPFALVELSRLVERSELGIYRALKQDPDFSLKRFRQVVAERKAVVEEVESAWDQVKAMASPLPLTMGDNFEASLIDSIKRHKVDGYDALYCYFMRESKVFNILSDDKDFRSVADFNLYSCYER